MIKKILAVGFTVGLVTCSASIFAKAPQRVVLPTIVEVAPVKAMSLQQKIMATGTVIAIPGIVVRPETAGRITKMYFKPGDDVAAGTPLIEINPDPLKAQLAQYEADLKLAEVNYQRYAELYKEHVVSKADFDQKQADRDATKAQVDQTSALLRQTTVTAPFAGRLGLNLVNLGDYVATGQTIVNLQMLDPIHVNFSVPEIYSSQLLVGQNVIIHSSAYPNEDFAGKIEAIDPLIDANARSINARAIVANKDKKLLPGGFAEVVILVAGPQAQIVISQTALVFAPDGNYVYRLIKGKAVKTPVTIGKRDAQYIVIEKGLAVGDVIVTAGQLKIVGDNATVVVAGQNKKPTTVGNAGSGNAAVAKSEQKK